jgi:hypothetical protein
MKHLKRYKIFESKSSLKFVKQPIKKGAKTETYNVVKDGEVIGQIKWSSRMRGYAFLPEKQHDDEIKNFIKNLMSKREKSKLKTNESIKESESKEDIIQTIKDILLTLSDLDYTISVTQNNLYRRDFNIDSLIGYEFIIRIVRYTDKPLVITDEIKEDFITMNDYLESEGFTSIKAHYVRELFTNSADSQIQENFVDFIKSIESWAIKKISTKFPYRFRNLLFSTKKIESE